MPPMSLSFDISISTSDLAGYDTSATRKRHVRVIREYLNLHPYKATAQQTAQAAMEFAVMSKHDLGLAEKIEVEGIVLREAQSRLKLSN